MKNFDVGLVPYRISEYTANVYPTKLNEYLIMGIPVVATDLFEIRRFNGEHGDLIRVASSVDDYVKAIRASIEKSPAPVVARRIEVAQSNSWDRRLEAMSALIDKASAEKAASTAGWEGRLRCIYNLARRRALQIVVPIAIALLLIFYTPLAWWIAEPLRMSSPPQAGRRDRRVCRRRRRIRARRASACRSVSARRSSCIAPAMRPRSSFRRVTYSRSAKRKT